MNHHRARVKQEYPGASSSASDMASPRPMDCLHDAGPPPFLTKTYDIVDDPTSDHIISWSKGNNSFVVWDSQAFSMSLLPRYFKHNNFSSFIRQLNTYGFRKVDPDRWEFANEGFLRGQKHLLKNIRRRKSLQTQASSSQHSLDSCVEVGIFGLDREIDRLKRDKQVLMLELVKLRQQQQTSRGYLQEMEQRIHKTELKQQQMMKLLAKAMKNPEFIQQLVQQNDKRKELEEVINKKRRRPIDQGQCSIVHDPDLGTSFVKVEPEYYGDIAEFEGINELDTLRIDEDNFFREELLVEEEGDRTESRVNRVLDEDFWECLMNESNEEGIGLLDTRNETEEDVDVLVEQLGFSVRARSCSIWLVGMAKGSSFLARDY